MAICEDEEDCFLGNSLFVKDCALLLIIGHSLLHMWSLHNTLPFLGLMETNEILTTVGLYLISATVLASAFYGAITSSAIYFWPFCSLQYVCYCGFFGYELYQSTFSELFGTQFYLQIVYMMALVYGMFYCLVVSNQSLVYFEKIQRELQSSGSRIGVFRQKFFGTPPLRRYDQLETPRASIISESFRIDDIFDDYNDSVKLE